MQEPVASGIRLPLGSRQLFQVLADQPTDGRLPPGGVDASVIEHRLIHRQRDVLHGGRLFKVADYTVYV